MLISIVAGLALPLASGPEAFYASTERFGYTGTVSVYNTLSDAQNGRNARYSAIVVPQRDGSIYLVRNRPTFYEDFNAFLTNWYSNSGQNPNNKNEAFVQMYDDNASNWQNQKGYWNREHTVFTVEAKGKDATYPSRENPGDLARLWNAGAPQGSGESTKGTYLVYEYKLVATGLAGTDPDGDGFFESAGNAASYSGYFKGIFRNESERYPASNGFYVVNLVINSTSWAVTNSHAGSDNFGSNTVK